MKGLGVLLIAVVMVAAARRARFWERVKTDCGFSSWSVWLECGGFGKTERYREIVRVGKNGGKPCPSNPVLAEAQDCTPDTSSADLASKQSSVPAPVDTNKTVERVVKSFSKNFLQGADRSVDMILGTHTQHPHYRRTKRQAAPSSNGTILPRDVLFLIDTSSSIPSDTWWEITLGLSDIVNKVCNGVGPEPGNNRFAAFVFSSRSIKIFDFDDYFSMRDLRRALMEIPYYGDSTCTGTALREVREWLNLPISVTGARENDVRKVRREVLILTDGLSNCNDNVTRMADELKGDGVTVFTLAIGRYSDKGKREIESLVSKPYSDHLFSLSTFTQFKELAVQLDDYPFSCVPLPFTSNRK